MTFSEALMKGQKKQFTVLVQNQTWQGLPDAGVSAVGVKIVPSWDPALSLWIVVISPQTAMFDVSHVLFDNIA